MILGRIQNIVVCNESMDGKPTCIWFRRTIGDSIGFSQDICEQTWVDYNKLKARDFKVGEALNKVNGRGLEIKDTEGFDIHLKTIFQYINVNYFVENLGKRWRISLIKTFGRFNKHLRTLDEKTKYRSMFTITTHFNGLVFDAITKFADKQDYFNKEIERCHLKAG
jgi:hypothetical protein